METAEIYTRLTAALREVFDDSDIVASPDLSAADVEDWDSLKHIRLILTVENAFGIRFSASEIGNLRKVADLASLIQCKT